MRDVVGAGDFDQRFPRFATSYRLPDLVGRELGLPTELDAPRHGPPAAFVRANTDQFPLEFGKAAKHSQHEPTMRSGRIRPGIRDRAEAGPFLCDSGEHVEQSRVLRASRSSRVTSKTSPAPSASIDRCNCRRSALAPETFSAKTLLAPAAFSAAC